METLSNQLKISIILLFLLFSSIIYGQTHNIMGDWLLTTVRVNDSIKYQPYYFMNFSEEGFLISSNNQKIGQWKFDNKHQTIKLSSEWFEAEFSGIKDLIFPESNKMIIAVSEKVDYHFERLNWEKINKIHQNSGLLGDWNLQFNNNKDGINVLSLREDGKYKFVNSSLNGSTTSHNGLWIYDISTNELITSASKIYEFNGKNELNIISPENFMITTSKGVIKATNAIKDKSEIDWLDFDINFEQNEDEAEKLPVLWKMYDKMLYFLESLNYIRYDFAEKIEDTEILKHSTIQKNITAKPGKKSVSFENIHITRLDSMQYSENYKGHLMEMNNLFFPEPEPNKFKVIGIETISIPAGRFECTVIEAISNDKKIKYWMINNQPGIYAQIIEQKPNRFTDDIDYKLYQLKKIVLK